MPVPKRKLAIEDTLTSSHVEFGRLQLSEKATCLAIVSARGMDSVPLELKWYPIGWYSVVYRSRATSGRVRDWSTDYGCSAKSLNGPSWTRCFE